MKKSICMLFVGLSLLISAGCELLTNIDGWDASACESGWNVCAELGWDNYDKIQEQLP